jgi:hypothetical protein
MGAFMILDPEFLGTRPLRNLGNIERPCLNSETKASRHHAQRKCLIIFSVLGMPVVVLAKNRPDARRTWTTLGNR